jgi:hypothetical protein
MDKLDQGVECVSENVPIIRGYQLNNFCNAIGPHYCEVASGAGSVVRSRAISAGDDGGGEGLDGGRESADKRGGHWW